ncbi:hypothetical protein CPB85DRAFT_1340496 [Mucidula mucida]|nr:hypothetical protein CPB85DRAFT_1340496 [Mucidula mucida]
MTSAANFEGLSSRTSAERHVVLMTACGNDRDAAFFHEYLALVRGTDVPLYWISASCEQKRLVVLSVSSRS